MVVFISNASQEFPTKILNAHFVVLPIRKEFDQSISKQTQVKKIKNKASFG